MCDLYTKCILVRPLEVRDAEFDNSCGSSETLCIILGADQLAWIVVDWRRDNIMSVDDLCESYFSRGTIDRPLLNVECSSLNFLRGCFIASLCILFSGKEGLCGSATHAKYSVPNPNALFGKTAFSWEVLVCDFIH